MNTFQSAEIVQENICQHCGKVIRLAKRQRATAYWYHLQGQTIYCNRTDDPSLDPKKRYVKAEPV